MGLQTAEDCFICHESLEIKLDSEKILPLVCGDCVHQECLSISVQHLLERGKKLGLLHDGTPDRIIALAIYPECGGDRCVKSAIGTDRTCHPVDKTIIEEHVKDARLSIKLEKIEDSMPVTPSMNNRPSSIPDGFSSIISTTSPARSRVSRFSVQSDVSDISNWPKAVPNHGVPLEKLRNAFIQLMLDKIPQVDLSRLVSLGNLRLVDELLVADSGAGPFVPMTAYLFTHYLVLIKPDRNQRPDVIPLDSSRTMVHMPTPSVLQITAMSADLQPKSVSLHSKTSSIIEKWGIGVSDTLVCFPAHIFTSTIELSQNRHSKPNTLASPKPISPILESKELSPHFGSPEENLPDLIKDLGLNNDLPRESLPPLPDSVSRPTSPLRLRASTHTLPYCIDSPSLESESGDGSKFDAQASCNVFRTPSLSGNYDSFGDFNSGGVEYSGTHLNGMDDSDSDGDSDVDSDDELIESVIKHKRK